jgi:hypothetical protein
MLLELVVFEMVENGYSLWTTSVTVNILAF